MTRGFARSVVLFFVSSLREVVPLAVPRKRKEKAEARPCWGTRDPPAFQFVVFRLHTHVGEHGRRTRDRLSNANVAKVRVETLFVLRFPPLRFQAVHFWYRFICGPRWWLFSFPVRYGL